MLLIWRFFKRAWPVQLAVTILLTSAVVIFALYGAFIERQGDLLGVRFASPIPEGVYLIEVGAPQLGPSDPIPFRGFREPPVDYLAGWGNVVLRTSMGDVLTAVLDDEAALYFALEPGTALAPAHLAETRGVSPGDTLTVISNLGALQMQVVGINSEPLFGQRLVIADPGGLSHMQQSFLYRARSGERIEDVERYIGRLYPSAVVSDSNRGQSLAKEIVDASYSPGARARLELTSFITLAFLSASLLSFLDRRRILAILKAMGLRASELAGIIAGEGMFAPVLGALFGALISSLLLLWMARAGLGVAWSWRLIITSVLSIAPAALVGLAIPARLAQVASVNQLLFERPIPLMTATVKGLRRRWPSLEPMMAQGVQFVKLDVVEGHFEGFIFRKQGDMVKEGEVLAVSSEWWGLRTKEFLSPATGKIVFYNQDAGFFGIKPEEWQP
ncbi:MAG TPA: hypothetical protein VK905_00455 [Bacillota bacterium]|nr:hypothetical protein [Bacillota bacterium]